MMMPVYYYVSIQWIFDNYWYMINYDYDLKFDSSYLFRIVIKRMWVLSEYKSVTEGDDHVYG